MAAAVAQLRIAPSGVSSRRLHLPLAHLATTSQGLGRMRGDVDSAHSEGSQRKEPSLAPCAQGHQWTKWASDPGRYCGRGTRSKQAGLAGTLSSAEKPSRDRSGTEGRLSSGTALCAQPIAGKLPAAAATTPQMRSEY